MLRDAKLPLKVSVPLAYGVLALPGGGHAKQHRHL